MRKGTHKGPMAIVLEDLINDGRLSRLFSIEARHCALQLWVLQIHSGQSIENRVVYGRLLPYSHSSDSWTFSDNDDFRSFGQVRAKVTRLNLYVSSVLCADLLRRLSAGWSISAISEALGLRLPDKLEGQFGSTALTANDLVFRPVAYLLNRDAHEQRSLSSPHGGAGAFSASITQANKEALFLLGQEYDATLIASVVKHLNADTGLDFGGVDAIRFGDLELLVFPTLDDLERCLLSVDWVDAPPTWVARFNPVQVPHFRRFQFRLCIRNDCQVVYSSIALGELDEEATVVCRFEVSDQLREMTDNTEIEVFGFQSDDSRQGVLCCRWGGWYVREIHLNAHVVGGGTNPVKFDWLEKTTHPSATARVKTALTIKRDGHGFNSQVGRREADPWVPVNRNMDSLFKKLHPPKSEGQFFPRWGSGNGEGRLQFVEWFKALLANYPQHEVVIFDPYFDAAGLGLLSICAAPQAHYIVFRSLPKPLPEGKPLRRKSDRINQDGIDSLLVNCEQNRLLLGRIKLHLYGLKEGRLHDRYILIMGADGIPVAGFNLSNSLQKAAENYPLLVTPIPADILLKVEQYKSTLVQEAQATQSEGEIESPGVQLLFDTTETTRAPRRYEPLRCLERAQAGDVLSVWTGESSLRGLSEASLKKKMEELGLIEGGSLVLPETPSLCNYLDQQAGDFAGFSEAWEVLGEVLAHSQTEDHHFREIEGRHEFLEFLTGFLSESFCRKPIEGEKELAVLDPALLRTPLETLLHSSNRVDVLYRPTKYTALKWSEYFTIKFLWWYAADGLLPLVEAQIANLPTELQGSEVVQLSLLSQIISEISLSIQFDISDAQRDGLIRSGNGLLQWLGLNAIERQLDKPGGLAVVLRLLQPFADLERVRALGWMVHHAARNQDKTEVYKGLVMALHEALSTPVSAEELRHLVDSMRGHMRQLAWAEPWLFRDVILPLLNSGRVRTDDASEIWVQELVDMLEPQSRDRTLLFDLAREGQTTNIAASLVANSAVESREAYLKSIKRIMKRQRRVVQQPLASTSDWAEWDRALTVSLWILTFSRWSEYYLRQLGMNDHDLEQLSCEARELALVRPLVEWRSQGPGRLGPLAEFLDQVEELLLLPESKPCVEDSHE